MGVTQVGSVEPPRPLQPTIVKVISGRPYGLLCCVVQGLVAHAELSRRNCSQPLKVLQSSHCGLALNLVLCPKNTGAHQALAPHERACESVQGWGAQALGFSGSASSSCSPPPAHGARGGLRGVTGDFPARFGFAGAVEGRERRQGWLNSESKPLQSRTPQQEPGPISQREIGSQFCQLGEVTLRLALSLSAALGVVLSLPSAGQNQGMEQEPHYGQQVQLARLKST